MIPTGLLAVLTILALFFAVRRANLHPLAIVCAWMLSVFFEDVFYTIFALNLEWVEPSEKVGHVWLRVLGLYAVSPLLVVWTIDAIAGTAAIGRKLRNLATGVVSLLAVDAAMAKEGVWYFPDDWPAWGWLAKPFLLVTITALLVASFRRLLDKEGIRE